MSDTEYITKDNAILAIYSFPFVMRNSEILDRIANNIRFTHSEDVAPIVHAHWKNVKRVLNTEWGECSNCDRGNDLTRYCPYCGAKMESEE
jgi:hypothetical protein